VKKEPQQRHLLPLKLIKRRPHTVLKDYLISASPTHVQIVTEIHVLFRLQERRRRRWNNRLRFVNFSIPSSHITKSPHLFPLCPTHHSTLAVPRNRNAVKTACLSRNPANSPDASLDNTRMKQPRLTPSRHHHECGPGVEAHIISEDVILRTVKQAQ
jgi:hypothetical protein